MSKCHGCGIELQNFDNKLLGYTKNLDSDLCERCFRIKHYNDYQKVIKDNNWVFSILKSIKPNALVVLVIDIINIPLDFSFLKNLKIVKGTILFLCTIITRIFLGMCGIGIPLKICTNG